MFKVGLSYAAKTWGVYLIAMLLSLFFLAGTGVTWVMITLNVLVLLVFALLIFNDGAYNGEKACTLQASMDKHVQEGRRVDESQRVWTFNPRNGAIAFLICVMPFLILSAVNLAAAPYFPETAEEETQEREAFTYDYEAAEAAKAAPVNWVGVAARTVFMPYVCMYSLVSQGTLNILFFLYSLFLPAFGLAGYLCGPAMRKKKLRDIALGKKRKMRNLKVNRTRKPRGPKAEV